MFDEMQSVIAEFDMANAHVDAEIQRVVREKGTGDDDLLPGVEELATRLMYGDLE